MEEDKNNETLTFTKIYHEKNPGTIKFEPSEITWEPSETLTGINSKKILSDKLKSLVWFQTSRGFLLRCCKKKNSVDFINFQKKNFDTIQQFCSDYYSLEIKVEKSTSKGWNWGDLDIDDQSNTIVFKLPKEGRTLDVPLDNVKNCEVSQRSKELVIEFHDDDTISTIDDCLVEMRFSFPKDSEEELTDIQNQIIKKADIGSETNEAIVSFTQLPIIAPRGRYNVSLFRKYMRLRGKTHDFKILYKSIGTMFLLPSPDTLHTFIVISLDKPIRSGKTPHFHIVFEFENNSTIKKDKPLLINLPKEEILNKYKQKGIGKRMNGKTFDLVARLFRAITGKKLIGSGKFESSEGAKGIKCSHKANSGFLFFLEKSIFFLHKPPLYFRHQEIRSFKFKRAERDTFKGGSKYFDLLVLLKNEKRITFSNIYSAEYDKLVDWIGLKKMRIENIKRQETKHRQMEEEEDDDEDEDDEDFVEDDIDSGEDDDDFEQYVESKEVEDYEVDKKSSKKSFDSKRKRNHETDQSNIGLESDPKKKRNI